MYLQLTKQNSDLARVCDDGWPFVEAFGQKWERTDPGVWQNNNTGEIAYRQSDDTWKVDKLHYTCIKSLMLDETERLRAA